MLASFALVFAAVFVAVQHHAAAASCQMPATTYGSVTTTITVPETATYRVWTRMMASGNNNTYKLAIDNANCYDIGGNNVSAANWTWVDYQDGNTGSKVELSLTKGDHSFKMIGIRPDVKLDHIIITSDRGCVPADNGDNCNIIADTTPPTVDIQQPKDAATVSGTIPVTAGVADDTGIAKVEYYINSTLLTTQTTAPFSLNWNTAKVVNGTQRITAKAYDKSGNFASDSVSVTVQNGDTVAPSQPKNLTATAPSHAKVILKWTASTDNVGVKRYSVSRDGIILTNQLTAPAYEDTAVKPGTAYTYQVTAIDAVGNQSAASAQASVTTPQVADTTPPSKPAGLAATPISAAQINLSWNAATDNIGVTSYEVYRARPGNTLRKIATVSTISYGDTNLRPDTAYRYAVKARDANGNTSPMSDVIRATTRTADSRGVIRGTVRNDAGKPLPYARVIVKGDQGRRIYRANSKGMYTVRILKPDRYTVTYKARRHEARTIQVTLRGLDVITKNIRLQGN